VYSKGGRAVSDQGFQASLGGNNPAGDGLSMFGGLDYVYRSGHYKQIAGIGYGTGSYSDPYSQIRRTYFSGSYGVERSVFRKIRWQALVGPQFKYFFVRQRQQVTGFDTTGAPLFKSYASNSQIMQLALPIDFETEVGGPFPAWLSFSISPVHADIYRDVNLAWQSHLRLQPVLGISIGRHLGL
jgi:hypothetical protein